MERAACGPTGPSKDPTILALMRSACCQGAAATATATATVFAAGDLELPLTVYRIGGTPYGERCLGMGTPPSRKRNSVHCIGSTATVSAAGISMRALRKGA